MNVKRVCLCGLVLALLGGAVRAQDAPAPWREADDPQVLPAVGPEPTPAPAAELPPRPMLSRWILYSRPDCCGPVGRDGVIGSELYLRIGGSVPAGGRGFNEVWGGGVNVEGGGRLLLFDRPATSAWTVDLGVGTVFNHGDRQDRRFTLNNIIVPGPPNPITGQSQPVVVPSIPVTVRTLNRTTFNFGLGREFYLAGSGIPDGKWNWRIGFDGGGRYGSARIELNELRHRTDQIWGAFLAGHTDIEVPFCGCMLFAGLRVEWGYTWMNILQTQNDTDLIDVNFLLTTGVRF